ncbi:MAG: Ldh family oxidoreductase [Fusobacteriaceae bacterium]|nr:Ldh family oxidoreductase [Fusobacteriaceae bacterium]
MKTRVRNEEITRVAAAILEKLGLPAPHAAVLAESLMDAEIRGVESHGFIRLPAYADKVRRGLISPDPDIKTTSTGCILKVDGGNGFGQIILRETLDRCFGIADQSGCAVAAVKNSNNFGAAGYFSRYAAEKGYIAYVTSNGGPVMVPFGGRKPMLGTDPFTVSFPAGKYGTFTLDVAVSAVALGKITLCEKQGKPIPEGWAVDSEGNDTTDPVAAQAGGMLPMAGHKGYGMAMITDMLCGLLGGARLSYEAATMFDKTSKSEIGHFACVLRLDAFTDPALFRERVEKWFDRLKSSPRRKSAREILIPGEIENRLAAENNGTTEILDTTLLVLENLQASL